MLPANVTDLVGRLFEADLRAQRDSLAQEIDATKSDSVRRGVLSSGFTAQRIKASCRGALKARVGRYWGLLQQVLTETRTDVGAMTPGELKELVNHTVDAQTMELATLLD